MLVMVGPIITSHDRSLVSGTHCLYIVAYFVVVLALAFGHDRFVCVCVCVCVFAMLVLDVLWLFGCVLVSVLFAFLSFSCVSPACGVCFAIHVLVESLCNS